MSKKTNVTAPRSSRKGWFPILSHITSAALRWWKLLSNWPPQHGPWHETRNLEILKTKSMEVLAMKHESNNAYSYPSICECWSKLNEENVFSNHLVVTRWWLVSSSPTLTSPTLTQPQTHPTQSCPLVHPILHWSIGNVHIAMQQILSKLITTHTTGLP